MSKITTSRCHKGVYKYNYQNLSVAHIHLPLPLVTSAITEVIGSKPRHLVVVVVTLPKQI